MTGRRPRQNRALTAEVEALEADGDHHREVLAIAEMTEERRAPE